MIGRIVGVVEVFVFVFEGISMCTTAETGGMVVFVNDGEKWIARVISSSGTMERKSGVREVFVVIEEIELNEEETMDDDCIEVGIDFVSSFFIFVS